MELNVDQKNIKCNSKERKEKERKEYGNIVFFYCIFLQTISNVQTALHTHTTVFLRNIISHPCAHIILFTSGASIFETFHRNSQSNVTLNSMTTG